MSKKILYSIGGIFIFFILIVIIASSSGPKISQDKKGSIAVENKEVATATAEITATSSELLPVNISNKQIAEIKSTQPEKPVPVATIQANQQYEYYSVSSVVDGDTVKVNINGTIETLRLIGIDTSETVDPRKPVQCFGKEASDKAKELLAGKKVRIEKDSTQGDLDKYGRSLVYIYREDGLFYNQYMIEQGYAHEYTYDTPYKYQAKFKAAQKLAQDNLRGLWSPNTCNGDTASSAVAPVSPQAPSASQSTGKYYTSSYSTSKYYYPALCSEWQSLSPSYLKAFDSLEALLAAFPSRTLSPQCQ